MAKKKAIRKRLGENAGAREQPKGYHMDMHGTVLLGVSFLVIVVGTVYFLNTVFGLDFENLPFLEAQKYGGVVTYTAECLPEKQALENAKVRATCCLVDNGTACTTSNKEAGFFVRCDSYNRPVTKTGAMGTCSP